MNQKTDVDRQRKEKNNPNCLFSFQEIAFSVYN